MNGTFHPSAYFAAMRQRTLRSPPPPIQMGSRSCTGFGSHFASVSVKNSPVKSVRLLGEQAAHALDGLVDHPQPCPRGAVGDPVGRVLHLHPAATEPEGDAAVGDLVERRHRVREHRRVPVARGVHEAPAAHASRWPRPAPRATRPPRGSAGCRSGRRRRSGPRSRSTRSRGPRCGARDRCSSAIDVFCRPVWTPKRMEGDGTRRLRGAEGPRTEACRCPVLDCSACWRSSRCPTSRIP